MRQGAHTEAEEEEVFEPDPDSKGDDGCDDRSGARSILSSLASV